MSALRRASRFWTPARDCLSKARVYRGIYKCNLCSTHVGPKEIKVDHIEPVIPIEGFVDWNDVINRLFCEESGYQAICKTCHDAKTLAENELRRICKKEKTVVQSSRKSKRKSD
jgi:hypothetical protein